MSLTNPLPRGIRETVLVSAPGQTVFGPFGFTVYADVDVDVLVAVPGVSVISAVLQPKAAFTVTPAAPAIKFPAYFMVTLNNAQAAGSTIIVRGARIPERTTDVTRSGVIQSQALENELDRQIAVEQELRRDVDRNVKIPLTNDQMFWPPAATLKGNPLNSTAEIRDFTIQGLPPRGAPNVDADRLLIWDAATGQFKNVSPRQLGIIRTPPATLRGNPGSTTSEIQDFTIQGLPSRVTPDPELDRVLMWNPVANRFETLTPGQIAVARTSGVPTFNGRAGPATAFCPPLGRLTLLSGTPVLTSDYAGAEGLYYTADKGNQIPVRDGTVFILKPFTEMFHDLADASRSPAAVVQNQNYDMFHWNDGADHLAHGPPWTSGVIAGDDWNRGSGAGSTELIRVDGVWMNRYAILNGPPALTGVYLGSFRSNPYGKIDFVFGARGVGGVAAMFGLWNAYNRRSVPAYVANSIVNWKYTGGNGAWREVNGGNTMRIWSMRGLDEDPVDGTYHAIGLAAAGGAIAVGVGLDVANAFTGTAGFGANSVSSQQLLARCNGLMGAGWHSMIATEHSTAAGDAVFVGSANSNNIQSALIATLEQ